jgi:hypothetical protein
MKLTFSVLWFDDNEEYFDSLDLEPLEQEISSWGFSPKIIPVTTPEEFRKYLPFKEIDLIVVDRNLEQYPEGQEFIAELRNHAIYTEVIFYTAGMATDLWNAIREKQLEGVFVSPRNEILSKISKVGHQSVRKVLDLENMRGIVMAELGELDHLIADILRLGIPTLPTEKQNTIFKKFHKQLMEQSEKTIKRLEEFNKNPRIDEMLDLSDSYKHWLNFKRLSESHEKMKNLKSVGDFEAEILRPRNSLAHGKPEFENGVYVFRHQGKEYRFDEDVSAELRKTILRHKKGFEDILDVLKR